MLGMTQQKQRIKARRARRTYLERINNQLFTYEWVVREHYSLPPTDPRFLSFTRKQLRDEYFRIIQWSKIKNNRIQIGPDGKPLVQELDGSDAFERFEEMLMRGVKNPLDDLSKLFEPLPGWDSDTDSDEWIEVDPMSV